MPTAGRQHSTSRRPHGRHRRQQHERQRAQRAPEEAQHGAPVRPADRRRGAHDHRHHEHPAPLHVRPLQQHHERRLQGQLQGAVPLRRAHGAVQRTAPLLRHHRPEVPHPTRPHRLLQHATGEHLSRQQWLAHHGVHVQHAELADAPQQLLARHHGQPGAESEAGRSVRHLHEADHEDAQEECHDEDHRARRPLRQERRPRERAHLSCAQLSVHCVWRSGDPVQHAAGCCAAAELDREQVCGGDEGREAVGSDDQAGWSLEWRRSHALAEAQPQPEGQQCRGAGRPCRQH